MELCVPYGGYKVPFGPQKEQAAQGRWAACDERGVS
jgi:hypothetical protein